MVAAWPWRKVGLLLTLGGRRRACQSRRREILDSVN